LEKRSCAVAGSFYPRYEPDLLRILKDSFLDKNFGPGEEFKTLNKDERTIIGGVSPHAGYVYSGCAAAYTFLNLFKEKIPDTVIILGNDHIGYGKVGLMKEGIWETPLGNLNIDSEVTQEILNNSKVIIEDNSAFLGFPFGREHNIEVQLPFIKYCAGDNEIKIVPIKVSSHKLDVLKTISNDIAKSIKAIDKDIVIIASSDMSHEEVHSKDELKKFKIKDHRLIEGFENLDPEKTLDPYPGATICGRQTITSLILTCNNLAAKSANKLTYYTSSEKTGNIGGYCVGYFSGIISK
jgi:AmmeMemoRadiSam system protein B